ncbi:MAG: hypothetical protein ACYDAN_00410 [Candidatus Limnocylindrales bacterium]
MPTESPARLRGVAHRPGEAPGEAQVALDEASFTVEAAGAIAWTAGYRDIASVALDAGVVTVGLGTGPGAEAWQFERFGNMTGLLVRRLRDGRLRQRLADGLVQLDAAAEVDLVEYAAGAETGVAQVVHHDRGVVLAPVDERMPWRRVRRADIGRVDLEASVGGVAIGGAGPSLPPAPDGGPALRLLRLGALATEHRNRWAALRDGTAADAAAIVAGLIPDAPFSPRSLASRLMLEGRAVGPAQLGEGWPLLEAATLGVPPFDESYRVLRAIGGGDAAPRWLACAPERPGAPEAPKVWFLVGLPGNLIALELVSEGSHATYLFRVVSRAAFTGVLPPGALEAAVNGISEALIDARFLREPMALPGAQLAAPAALRYRLALAALPSLAMARAAFVARIVHRDAASWEAAVRDLVAWHAISRDDSAEWPGRTAQEAQVSEAAAGDD